MTSKLKISLKPNERIYINGAVVRVDRKVSIEFLNDVQFLLQNHVLQPEDANTPLRQLYFIAQIILMTPDSAVEAKAMFRKSLTMLLASFVDDQILAALKDIDRMVVEGDVYEALKAIRALYPRERAILDGRPVAAPSSHSPRLAGVR